jgi:hypothetical protein
MLAVLFAVTALTEHATNMFIDYVGKRLVGAMIDETSNRALSALGSIGSLFSQTQSTSAKKDSSQDTETGLKETVSQALNHIGVSLVYTEELAALLKIAEAADGGGNVKKALADWKKIATLRANKSA